MAEKTGNSTRMLPVPESDVNISERQYVVYSQHLGIIQRGAVILAAFRDFVLRIRSYSQYLGVQYC